MEGFLINLIGTLGFSSVFLVIFFSIYYLYLRGNDVDIFTSCNKWEVK